MKLLLVSGLLVLSYAAISQTYTSERIYDRVEQMPQFPGGDDSLRHYLLYHIEYPIYSRNHHIEGRVDIRFTVGEDGRISDIKVIQGQIADIDSEAVRVVRSFPLFTPGIHDGHPVSVALTLPIVFQLAENEGKRKKVE